MTATRPAAAIAKAMYGFSEIAAPVNDDVGDELAELLKAPETPLDEPK